MKKNKVVWLQMQDNPSLGSNRWATVFITRQGAKRVSKVHLVRGASRRRMLRVLEAM